MDNFNCQICFEKFEDPVECLKCNNNFCKKHVIKIENGCPMCKNIPFKWRENVWLKRTILSLDSYCICAICQWEGDENSFWSHLIENHKKEIILNYKLNKNSSQNQENNTKRVSNKDINNQSNNGNLNEVSSVNGQQKTLQDFINSLNNISSNNNNNNNNIQNEKGLNQNMNQNNYNNNNNYFNIQNETLLNQNMYQNNYYNNNNDGNNNNDNDDNDDNDGNDDNYNNNFNRGINTHRINPSGPQKQFVNKPPLTGRNIIYCGQKNRFINCTCCLDHTCKKGNCICVICMAKNIRKFNLRNGQLINKSGNIASPIKGSYYCGNEYETIIENVIGLQFRKHLQCNYPLEPCNDCKILTKFKDIYNKKCYNIK